LIFVYSPHLYYFISVLVLAVVIALSIFLIEATLLIEDKFIDLVNIIIPDGTVVSIYTEKSNF